MIPSLSSDGVLPPFLPGTLPHELGAMAPYRSNLLEVAHKFSTTDARKEILKGLLTYRKELRAAGFVQGMQWIDGSFVEDCEKLRGRPPSDLDLVTFSTRPPALQKDNDKWKIFFKSRPDLFDFNVTKATYKCDAYFIDLGVHPWQVVCQVRYWFGLFSHQRDTYQWKGMIEIPLAGDDNDVQTFLSAGAGNAS